MPCTLSAFTDEAGPSCAQQIAAAQAAGLHYLDLRSIDGHNISVLPLDLAARLADALAVAGLQVNMFGTPLGKVNVTDDLATELRKLEHLAKLADILHCRALRIFSFYNRAQPALPPAAFARQALAHLKKLTQVAQDLGLVLYHENEAEIFGDKARDVLTIAQELRAGFGAGNGAFRMIFDFGNFNAGHEDVWQNWWLLRSTTDGIHIKDNIWQNHPTTNQPELQHVLAGEGQGQILRILQDAAQQGFTGPITIEPHVAHSAAVVATGPTGIGNQALANMTTAESFQLAAVTARNLCLQAGLQIA